MKFEIKSFLLGCVATSLAACAVYFCKSTMDAQNNTVVDAQEVHWSYDGATGPAHWGDLSPRFAVAKYGKAQSPINIETEAAINRHSLEYFYEDGTVALENNGHAIQMTLQNKVNYVILDGMKYVLSQIHFHSKSEHTIDKKQFPLEAHLVHTSEEGFIAVVGVLFEEGEKNTQLAEMFEKLPQKTEQLTLENTIIVSELIPFNGEYFRYSGSLTTPVTAEGVKWVVYKAPLTLGKEQLQAFANVYDHNFRQVQPLNGRTVIKSR